MPARTHRRHCPCVGRYLVLQTTATLDYLLPSVAHPCGGSARCANVNWHTQRRPPSPSTVGGGADPVGNLGVRCVAATTAGTCTFRDRSLAHRPARLSLERHTAAAAAAVGWLAQPRQSCGGGGSGRQRRGPPQCATGVLYCTVQTRMVARELQFHHPHWCHMQRARGARSARVGGTTADG